MNERQKHGFSFQKKYCQDNSLSENTNYTGKYDAFDTNGVPYKIKCIKYKSSIDMSDYFRNAGENRDFFLVIGFWKGNRNAIIETHKLFIPAKDIREMLSFTEKDIMKHWIINSVKNDRSYDSQWKRERVKFKEAYESERNRYILLRFKRDHKKQRRIQCAINNKVFYQFFVKRYSA